MMLKEYLYAEESARSSNVDASNRTLSVLDENEADQILVMMTKDAITADNVWGDIHRNRYLSTLRDPPDKLTPEYGEDLHPAIKQDELHASKLWSTMIDYKAKKDSEA